MNDDIKTALGEAPAPDEAAKQAARARLIEEAHRLKPHTNHRATREDLMPHSDKSERPQTPIRFLGAAAALIAVVGVTLLAATLNGGEDVGSATVPTPALLTNEDYRTNPNYIRLSGEFLNNAYRATVLSPGYLPEGFSFEEVRDNASVGGSSVTHTYICKGTTISITQEVEPLHLILTALEHAQTDPAFMPTATRGTDAWFAQPNGEFTLLWQEDGQAIEVWTENAAACNLTEQDFRTFVRELRPLSPEHIAQQLAVAAETVGFTPASLPPIPGGFIPTAVVQSAPGEGFRLIGHTFTCGDVSLAYDQYALTDEMLPLGDPAAQTASPDFTTLTIREGQRTYLGEGGVAGLSQNDPPMQPYWDTDLYGITLSWDEAGYRHHVSVQIIDQATGPRAASCALTVEDVLALAEGIDLP